MSEALQALYQGDEQKARELLPADDDLTVFEAAAFGRTERLGRILDDDSEQVHAFSDDGFTALHLAIFGGQENAMRLLLERGADPNVISTSDLAKVPPLGTAAFVRSAPLAQVLLDSGADPNGRGEGGFTAAFLLFLGVEAGALLGAQFGTVVDRDRLEVGTRDDVFFVFFGRALLALSGGGILVLSGRCVLGGSLLG
ncbi:MAG: ankyrin repeat domain-containing protein, partial [Gaiellaceae bacterium]